MCDSPLERVIVHELTIPSPGRGAVGSRVGREGFVRHLVNKPADETPPYTLPREGIAQPTLLKSSDCPLMNYYPLNRGA